MSLEPSRRPTHARPRHFAALGAIVLVAAVGARSTAGVPPIQECEEYARLAQACMPGSQAGVMSKAPTDPGLRARQAAACRESRHRLARACR